MWTLRTWSTVLGLLCLSLILHAQKSFDLRSRMNPTEDRWVDSVYNALDEDARLGQLFMIRAHSDLGADHIAQVERTIRDYKVGSLCFFQGTPEKQAELTNRYQQLSAGLPLMIAIDAEWGLGMRMKASTISYPRQLMLGAIQDNDLIYEMGREVGRQLKRIGIHVNFAPVVDINNNAANPVINTRSFGEDRYNVTIKSYMYMKGMQDVGVMACAKHFPGHGDTDVDSHMDLPVINHSRRRLDSVELYPFRILSKEGVGSMMVAHLSIPVLENRPNRPTSLSRNTVTNLLRDELDFQGLIFTDALEMKGVTKYFGSGQVEAESLLAGNDILCLPEDIAASMREIKRYLAEGLLQPQQVEASVKRVLRSKYRLGIHKFQPIPLDNVRKELNSPQAEVLKRGLIRESLTMVRNRDGLVPFLNLDSMQFASLSIGVNGGTPFQDRLEDYKSMLHLQASKNMDAGQTARMLEILGRRDVVIVGLHNMSQFAKDDFGITQSTREFLEALNRRTRVVLVVFGNPYSLKYFDRFEWVLEAYNDDKLTQDLAAQALFGVFGLRGRLPVTASSRSRFNAGEFTPKLNRIGFTIPEETGLSNDSLQKIDRIVEDAINRNAMPGCVVLVAQKGQIVFQKAYGYHTYANRQPTQVDDVFDLASVTKIAATTLSVMDLQGKGKINVQAPLSDYLEELQGSNKNGKTIADIMAHHAGLRAWIPFYDQTITKSRRNPQPLKAYYREIAEEDFNVPVADRLFMRNDFMDSIRFQIYHSDLRSRTDYRYSDLGFYMLADLVKEQTGTSLDQYVEEQFYRPLGLSSIMFNPLKRIEKERILPTERDRYFRRATVHGYVHDMGAAMLGGVSGHAGLFSSAHDLAVVMQMLLQDGKYGGRQYLQPGVVKQFATRHPRSTRRGIGFDMLQLDDHYSPNFSKKASSTTFGHLGFTGTAVWADPENELIYIFLSNRTYPSMNNYRLSKLNTRLLIHDVIYDALIEGPKNEKEKKNWRDPSAG